ncbi:MAG: OmpH family outer membrane protein, partial [bacterium]
LRLDYERAKEEYESQRISLSEEGKRAQLAEVESRKRRYDSYLAEVYGKGGKIDQKNQELLAPIVQQIDSVVRTVALEEGFALVVDAEKAGIIFGDVGLDLTELVLEELNRRYAPVATGPLKKVFAIMSIFESNDEAQRDRLGSQIRGFVNALLGAKTNIEVLPDRKVDEIAQTRGYGGQQLQIEQAIDIARALNADYCIFGECSKRERQINFRLAIVEVQTGVVLKSQDGDVERTEVLRERVSSVVQALYSSITP